MLMKRLLLLAALVACSPGLGGYPCTKDDECPTGSICGAGGKCQAGPACSAGQTLCHACVDLAIDTANCGSCGNACPGDPHGTASCASGSCALACGVGFVKQGAGCIGPPPAPSGLTAVGAQGSVALSWSAVAGADHYQIERGTSAGGPYTQLATTTGTTYSDTSAAPGTNYFYVVAAVNGAGAGALSAEAAALTAPAAPAGVTATPGSGQISLSWTASATATGYAVQRSTQSGGPYSSAGTSSVSSFLDSGLLDGTTYYYVVFASNASGTSLASTEVKATTRTATAGPGHLTAVGSLSAISLSWDAVTSASGYNIYRSSTNQAGSFNRVGNSTSPAFTDVTGVVSGSDYYYQVAAVLAGLEGGATSIAVPAAPSSLAASGSPNEVVLTWTGSAAATGYTIYRGPASNSYDTTFASTTARYDDQSAGNVAYFYQVQATAPGAIRNSIELPVPAAPTLLFANLPLPGNVPLAWTAPSPAPSGYHVLRSSGGAFAPLDTGAPLTATSYTDTDPAVTNAATFQYEVTSVIGSGSRASSPATIYAAPSTPLASGAATSINISWSAVTGPSSYELERATAAAGPFAEVGTLIGQTASPQASDSGTIASKEYWYRVRSYDSASQSAGLPSAVVHVPGQPTAPSLQGGLGNVKVTWTGGSGAAQFDVVRTNSGTVVPITNVGPSPYTDADPALSNSVSYSYDVEAKDGNGSRVSDSTQLLVAPVFAATTSVPAQINLSWSAVNGATGGYVVSSGSSATGPFTAGSPTSATSATDTTVAPSSSEFYVVQSVASGSMSMFSTVLAVPAAPAPSASGDPASIAIAWTGSGVESSWLVERGTSSGSYGTPASVFTPSRTDAVTSAAYFYRVTALGPLASRQGSELAVPSARTVSESGGGAGSVSLSWTAGSEGTPVTLTALNLQRTILGQSKTLVIALGAGDTSTTDAGLDAATAYQYSLQAVAGSASRNSATLLLPESASLTQANGFGAKVQLAWSNSPSATGYTVFRDASQIATPAAGTTTLTDTTANPAAHTYLLRASADLYRDSGTLTMPAPPTHLAPTATGTSISLTWDAVAGVTWRVLRSTSSGGEDPSSALASGLTSPSYTDASLTPDSTFFYVVQATAPNTQSFPSSETSATAIDTPTGLAGSQSNHHSQISWTPSVGASSYVVSRSSTLAGTYTQVGTPTAATFSETLTTSAIATVFYKVAATDGTHVTPTSAPLQVDPRQFCVLNTNTNKIESYDETQTSPATPLKMMTSPISGGGGGGAGSPFGLAADITTHDLFIAGNAVPDVFAFGLPLGAPPLPYSPLQYPQGTENVSAQAGMFFVVSSNVNQVNWYSQATGLQLGGLLLSGSAFPVDAQYDSTTGELFVLNSGTTPSIQVFDLATSTLKRSGSPNPLFSAPMALAIDSVNDKLYVSDNGTGIVSRFPSRTWTGSVLTADKTTTQATRPHGISLDVLGGWLRVTNINGGTQNVVFMFPLDLSGTPASFVGAFGNNCCHGPAAITLSN